MPTTSGAPVDMQFLGVAAALGSAASWALGAILFKRLGESLSPLAMTLMKSAVSIVLLGAAILIVGHGTMDPKTLAVLAGSGVLGIAVADTLFFEALHDLGARDMVVLLTVGQVANVLLAVVFLRERPAPQQWVGIGLIVLGVTTVLYSQITGPQEKSSRRGIVLGLLSALAMSVSYVMAKPALDATSALDALFVRMTAGAVAMFLLGLAFGRLGKWVTPFRSGKLVVFFLFAVCVITFGGFWLNLAAFKYSTMSLASPLVSTEPLFALPLAAIFLKERITFRALVGTAITMAGVVLMLVRVREMLNFFGWQPTF